MWTDCIDYSAQTLAAELVTRGIDRSAYMPVAAVACWSTTRGRVALRMYDSLPYPWLPINIHELPHLGTPEIEQSKTAIAGFLAPVLADLGLLERHVSRVSGLAGPASSYMLPGNRIPPYFDRRVGILPFLVDVCGCPRLRRGSWYSPSWAEEIMRQATSHDSHIGLTILRRMLSSPPAQNGCAVARSAV